MTNDTAKETATKAIASALTLGTIALPPVAAANAILCLSDMAFAQQAYASDLDFASVYGPAPDPLSEEEQKALQKEEEEKEAAKDLMLVTEASGLISAGAGGAVGYIVGRNRRK